MKSILVFFLAVSLAQANPYRELYDLEKLLEGGNDDPNMRVRVAQLAIATGNYRQAEEALQWLRKNNVPNWSEWATTQTKYLSLLGKQAPEFQGKDLDGWTIKRSDFEGRAVLIHFWNAVDVQSQSSVAQIVELQKKYKTNLHFTVFGVSLDKDKGTLQSVSAAKKVTWPQMFEGVGWDSPTAKAFQIQGTPMCVVIDQDGLVRYVGPTGQLVSDSVDAVMFAAEEKFNAAASGAKMTPRSKDGKVICIRPVEVYSPQDASKVLAKLKPGTVLTLGKVDGATGRAMVVFDDPATGRIADGIVQLPAKP